MHTDTLSGTMLFKLSIAFILLMPRLHAQVKYETQAVSPALQAKLNQAVGASVYTCAKRGFVMLADHDASGNKGIYYGAAATPRFVPVMTAMKIVGIEKIGQIGSRYLVGIRFESMALPAVAIDPAELEASANPIETIAAAAGLFTSRQASGIRFSDLDAVISGRVHAGMSEEEAECALGAPERSNEYGDESQDIYSDGSLVVYAAKGKIVDVQRFDQSNLRSN